MFGTHEGIWSWEDYCTVRSLFKWINWCCLSMKALQPCLACAQCCSWVTGAVDSSDILERIKGCFRSSEQAVWRQSRVQKQRSAERYSWESICCSPLQTVLKLQGGHLHREERKVSTVLIAVCWDSMTDSKYPPCYKREWPGLASDMHRGCALCCLWWTITTAQGMPLSIFRTF